MAGAGTDKTKNWIAGPAPVVVLVEPQLGENIGAAARAMANFGISRLRIVSPRDGWPNERARWVASGADRVIDQAEIFDSLEAAIADCQYVLATTARSHDQAKPVFSPEQAAAESAPRVASGQSVAILFGRERWGLQNAEVGLADAIVTFPVNPAFASLNLGQAVLLMGYEWFKLTTGNALPFAAPVRSPPAGREQLHAFFETLTRELDAAEFLRPAEKRETMLINLHNIFTRIAPTQQDIQTLHGVVLALAQGRKGPARGGTLDGHEAELLRALLAEREGAALDSGGAPAGLSRLLRRNPTEAERRLWQALGKDRRLAGRFKRQTPVGKHVCDFVSFGDRLVLDLVPADRSEEAARTAAERREWLAARGYRVVELSAARVEAALPEVLETIVSALKDGGTAKT